MSLFDLFGIVTNKRLLCQLESLEYQVSNLKLEIVESKIRETQMAINLDALIEQVTRNAEVDAAAYTLIVGLKAKVDELAEELADQPEVAAKIAELAAALDASSDALADAVIANTPVDPQPEEPPVEEPPVEEPPVEEPPVEEPVVE